MKITGIHINNFQQFNDFHVDLTYPKGHEKAGKPLEKICFIGQSGTGKTTLLNILKKLLYYVDVIINLLYVQDGLCAYTEIRLCNQDLIKKRKLGIRKIYKSKSRRFWSVRSF